jgi:hypothetical protein
MSLGNEVKQCCSASASQADISTLNITWAASMAIQVNKRIFSGIGRGSRFDSEGRHSIPAQEAKLVVFHRHEGVVESQVALVKIELTLTKR